MPQAVTCGSETSECGFAVAEDLGPLGTLHASDGPQCLLGLPDESPKCTLPGDRVSLKHRLLVWRRRALSVREGRALECVSVAVHSLSLRGPKHQLASAQSTLRVVVSARLCAARRAPPARRRLFPSQGRVATHDEARSEAVEARTRPEGPISRSWPAGSGVSRRNADHRLPSCCQVRQRWRLTLGCVSNQLTSREHPRPRTPSRPILLLGGMSPGSNWFVGAEPTTAGWRGGRSWARHRDQGRP